jgi:ABC-type arginine transport system permease subunit
MTFLLERLPASDFLRDFLAGMVFNYEIAGIALLMGLTIGLPLAHGSLAGNRTKALSGRLVSLMRAAPSFVVMFVLMNAIPQHATVLGFPVAPSGSLLVAMSLAPYAASYVFDNGIDALRNLRRGSPLSALLFLPSIVRAFFVLVMSSSAGAAIGVTEAVAVIVRETQQLPALHDKLLMFGIGVICFGLPLQSGFALVRMLPRRLSRMALSHQRGWVTTATTVAGVR